MSDKHCPYSRSKADDRGYTNHGPGCTGLDRIEMNRLQHDALRDLLIIKQTTIENLNSRLAEAETLLEIVAPLAYAQWKSGSCDPVEAVVGLNEPITGIADSADGVKG